MGTKKLHHYQSWSKKSTSRSTSCSFLGASPPSVRSPQPATVTCKVDLNSLVEGWAGQSESRSIWSSWNLTDVREKSSFQGLSDLCYKSFWSPSCHSISWAGLEGTQEPLSQRTFWNQSSLSVSAEQHRCSLFYHYNWKEFESSHLLQELKTRKFLLPCWEWNLDVLYTLAHLACWI